MHSKSIERSLTVESNKSDLMEQRKWAQKEKNKKRMAQLARIRKKRAEEENHFAGLRRIQSEEAERRRARLDLGSA